MKIKIARSWNRWGYVEIPLNLLINGEAPLIQELDNYDVTLLIDDCDCLPTITITSEETIIRLTIPKMKVTIEVNINQETPKVRAVCSDFESFVTIHCIDEADKKLAVKYGKSTDARDEE